MEDVDDLEPPPPAYDFSQQDFDQKIHSALEASQSDQQQAPSVDGGIEFEVWDDAVFAAAVGRLGLAETLAQDASESAADARTSAPCTTHVRTSSSAGSSSAGDSPTEVRPLRIAKKQVAQRRSTKKKERPRWYTDAQLEDEHEPSAPVPAPAPVAATPAPVPPPVPAPAAEPPNATRHAPRPGRNATLRVGRMPERGPTPPPEFTEVGPDLDGPPYEPYESRTPGPPEVVLTYVPGDSNPPSPLASPTMSARVDPFPFDIPPINVGRASSHRRALPRIPSQSAPPPVAIFEPSPTPAASMPPRPPASPNRAADQTGSAASLAGFKLRYGNPRVSFDPQMAYNSGRSNHHHHASESSPLPQAIDAAAFYTSAVSAVYVGGRGITSQHPTQNFTTPQARQSAPQVPLVAPQPRTPLLPQGLSASAAGRTSPAPSVQSVQSSHSQGYTNSRYSTYETSTPVANGHQANAYQPTSYQPTSYQPTSYQSTPYQPTSYQPSSYQPTTYSNTARR